MKTQLRLGAVVLSLFILSGSGCSSPDVQPGRVTFSHPDELIEGEGFMVLADRRVFAVMAFMNAMGYDEEVDGRQMHPVRVKVRERLQANLARMPAKARAWRAYYKAVDRFYLKTYNYQDYALTLCTDYPFRRIRPNSEVNYKYTVRALSDFPDVLNDFWESAGVGVIWEEIKPSYQAELRKYNFEKMNNEMTHLWQYLRMQRKDTLVLVNVPNLLERHYHGIGAKYDNHYYTVESPGSHNYGLNIHEYLHSIVNPIVLANYKPHSSKLQGYYSAGRHGPLSKSYGELPVFTFECLVRAVDERIRYLAAKDDKAREAIQARVENQTRQGLSLTQPFFLLLEEFERNDQPFDEYVPLMLERLPEHRSAGTT